MTGPDGRIAEEISANGDVALIVRAGEFAEQTRCLPVYKLVVFHEPDKILRLPASVKRPSCGAA